MLEMLENADKFKQLELRENEKTLPEAQRTQKFTP